MIKATNKYTNLPLNNNQTSNNDIYKVYKHCQSWNSILGYKKVRDL